MKKAALVFLALFAALFACTGPQVNSQIQTLGDGTGSRTTENTNRSEETPVPAGFVRVKGGTFQMGSNDGERDEKPVHTVTVKSFNISKYQVTQKEWQEVFVAGYNPSNFKGDKRPVENVSWYDAVDYCNRRSIKEGLTPVYSGAGNSICDWNANGYRLPTEAEWEFAARGGNGSPGNYTYSGSNSVDAVAWYDGNSGGSTHPVGTKAVNSLGIYDMSGNVWEWCWDWFGGYSDDSQTDPRGPIYGTSRVRRGGGWAYAARCLRSAYRDGYIPSSQGDALGFRLVRG
jgi:formylglycine-generating enzyme required for sulfatase activity